MEHCLRRSYLKGNQKLKRSSESKRFPWPNKYRRYWTVSKINVVESMSLSQEFIDHIIDLLVSTPHDTHRKALPPLLACLHIISLHILSCRNLHVLIDVTRIYVPIWSAKSLVLKIECCMLSCH